MVATEPEAAPRCFASTELIMALAFGEENREKPRPTAINMETMNTVGVCGVANARVARPRAVSPMPDEANKRGSRRSDILPARGEHSVIIRGWAIINMPAVCGASPRMFCRYKLIKKVIEKVAAYMISDARQE